MPKGSRSRQSTSLGRRRALLGAAAVAFGGRSASVFAAEESTKGPARVQLCGKVRKTGVFQLNAKKRLTLKSFLDSESGGPESDREKLVVQIFEPHAGN